jgi:ketosteroid isomerase-like protein
MKNTLWLLMVGFAMVGSAYSQKSANGEFEAFLASADAAQIELQRNGNAGPSKALWSHGDDVTLSGGFGGPVEKGWAAVSKRLDWAGANFSKGKNSIERLVLHHRGNLGYLVQVEHISFTAPATGKPATRDFRVTMVFRREKDGWRIVHRHADSQMTKQAPQ